MEPQSSREGDFPKENWLRSGQAWAVGPGPKSVALDQLGSAEQWVL